MVLKTTWPGWPANHWDSNGTPPPAGRSTTYKAAAHANPPASSVPRANDRRGGAPGELNPGRASRPAAVGSATAISPKRSDVTAAFSLGRTAAASTASAAGGGPRGARPGAG